MIKNLEKTTTYPPLIVQQDAERRNKEYVRVTKDGRISVIGMDKSHRNITPKSPKHPKVEKESSKLEKLGLTVSQPWK